MDLRVFENAKRYISLQGKVRKIKPILIKRKSAFTVYEWLEIKTILKIIE